MFNPFKKPNFAKQTISDSKAIKTIISDPTFSPRAEQVSDLDLLKKQVSDQQEIIRELVTIATWIANHKRFEHIQEKLIVVHNLVDKLAASQK